MKRVVERIGPLVPALATVGASICASSLLLAPGPQTLEPHAVVPSFTREAGRVVASLPPPAQPPSRVRAPVARSPGRRSLSAAARVSAASTPNLHRSSSQVGRPAASATPPPSPPSPPPSPPSPPPSPPVTPQPTPEPVTQAPTQNEKPPKDGSRPGWGHGDPNHDHTGPPSKGSKRQEDKPTTVGTGALAPVGDQHGPHQNGDKKSPGH
jgi:hypothetical protein